MHLFVYVFCETKIKFREMSKISPQILKTSKGNFGKIAIPEDETSIFEEFQLSIHS